MEIGFNAQKLQAAAYKIVKWEGDIEGAQKEIGKTSDLVFAENKKAFLKKEPTWCQSHYKNRFQQSGIEDGVPFVISGHKYLALDKEIYFVYGEFPGYGGRTQLMWVALSPEQMCSFLTPEGACEFIKNILSHGE